MPPDASDFPGGIPALCWISIGCVRMIFIFHAHAPGQPNGSASSLTISTEPERKLPQNGDIQSAKCIFLFCKSQPKEGLIGVSQHSIKEEKAGRDP